MSILSSDAYIILNKYVMKAIGLHEAILLGELCSEYIYWCKEDKLQDGYFFSTRENIEKETTLSPHQQRQALKNLVNFGFVDKQNTLNDKKLLEHFKNDKPTDRFSDINVASSILGRIDLRNFQRELGNLDGEEEQFPYNEEQIKMVDRYIELEHRQEELDNDIENEME